MNDRWIDVGSGQRDARTALAEQALAFVRRQGRPAWLVGGHVRDRLLGRPSHDVDLIVPEGAIRLARDIAAAFGGSWFVLDEARDVARAILGPQERTDSAAGGSAPPGPSTVTGVEVDVARLRAPDLPGDLALRDFTVNAIAVDVLADGGEAAISDPFGGREDLAQGTVRAVTEGAFHDDPLRMLRAVRLVAELGFRIEDATYNFIRRDAALLTQVSGERVRDELLRIVAAPGAWQLLRLLQRLELLRHALPESAAQVGITQAAPHYQDVFDHSRSVLWHLEGIYALLWPGSGCADPVRVPDDATLPAGAADWREAGEMLAPYADDLRAHLLLPLAAQQDRRALLRWAALAHDWGKPAKRAEGPDGSVHFYEHDHWGALLAEARLQSLRFSGDEVAYVARLIEHHMRPTQMVSGFPPTRRAIYRFFRDAGSTGPDCVLLSLADHMAIRAPAREGSWWQRRLETTAMMLDAYWRQRAVAVSPPPLLNGRQVMAALGIPPGPQVGELLEALREAQAVGEVTSVDGALAWLSAHAPPS